MDYVVRVYTLQTVLQWKLKQHIPQCNARYKQLHAHGLEAELLYKHGLSLLE